MVKGRQVTKKVVSSWILCRRFKVKGRLHCSNEHCQASSITRERRTDSELKTRPLDQHISSDSWKIQSLRLKFTWRSIKKHWTSSNFARRCSLAPSLGLLISTDVRSINRKNILLHWANVRPTRVDLLYHLTVGSTQNDSWDPTSKAWWTWHLSEQPIKIPWPLLFYSLFGRGFPGTQEEKHGEDLDRKPEWKRSCNQGQNRSGYGEEVYQPGQDGSICARGVRLWGKFPAWGGLLPSWQSLQGHRWNHMHLNQTSASASAQWRKSLSSELFIGH